MTDTEQTAASQKPQDLSTGSKKKAKKAAPTKAAWKPWSFPKHSLEEALVIPRAIEEKHAGKPVAAEFLARAVGFKRPDDWRFSDLLRAANQYGFVVGSGAKATIELAKLGQDIVAPEIPEQRKQALLTAFRNVEDFKKIEEFYGGKRIPEDEYFINTITGRFGIDRERVDVFRVVFLANLKLLGEFAAHDQGSPVVKRSTSEGQSLPENLGSLPKEEKVREFLDTCFVMMPFGSWFDRYYQDIYTKSIKDAGFEPVRADEIFTTGSVVEQVWEQISKATVLLADLTDKNPNVFYELGLAHAAGKPVVLTAAKLDDVPFDLRHLRVIVYDVREPEWAAKLFKSVSDHLKSAKSEPDKSIPQPFRKPTVTNGAE